MESTITYCGQCGKENPIDNNFCYNCGQKLMTAIQNDPSLKTNQPETIKYQDIHAALSQLIKTNGFIIISKGDYYVQFDSNLSKRQLYFDAVSHAFFPKIGNKDSEFSNLLFTIEKNSNYFKLIPTEKISVENLVKEIDIIFNKIYCIPLNNYEIKIELESATSPQQTDTTVSKGSGCFGTLMFLITVFSLGIFFVIMLLFLFL